MVTQGGPRHPHDPGDRRTRDPLLQWHADLTPLAVELRLAQRPLRPAEQTTPARAATSPSPVRSEILLAFDADALLDGHEADLPLYRLVDEPITWPRPRPRRDSSLTTRRSPASSELSNSPT